MTLEHINNTLQNLLINSRSVGETYGKSFSCQFSGKVKSGGLIIPDMVDTLHTAQERAAGIFA